MENVELASTAKKYEKMADVLVPMLFGLLRERLALDEDIWAKEAEIRKENAANGAGELASSPKRNALWDEYKTRYSELIEGRLSEELLNKSHAAVIGPKSVYFYINGKFKAKFTMRRENMATIITEFENDDIDKHKFVMRLIDGKWLLDAVYVWKFESWRASDFSAFY